MMDEILTVEQVAGLLDCEPGTVQNKARDNELPAIKFGRSWVFPRVALMDALNAKAVAHTSKVAPAPKAVKVKARPVLVGVM